MVESGCVCVGWGWKCVGRNGVGDKGERTCAESDVFKCNDRDLEYGDDSVGCQRIHRRYPPEHRWIRWRVAAYSDYFDRWRGRRVGTFRRLSGGVCRGGDACGDSVLAGCQEPYVGFTAIRASSERRAWRLNNP